MSKDITRTALSFCFIFLTLMIHAQVTLRIVSLPSNTPVGTCIFFAGSIQTPALWSPGDANYRLTPDENGFYSITLPKGKGIAQYKFTRGNWSTVETATNRSSIPNRTFSFSDKPQTIDLSIESWKDLAASTAASNVAILRSNFNMTPLGDTRRIWLYLPPDYYSSSKRYPVIYMQDGQNLFDNATAFAGEWEVDETLNKLHKEGDYGAIVVGIDNGGSQRINEYAPWKNPEYGGGLGDAYLDFIVQTLKPHIDSSYRTLSTPEYTCIFGSSLGALIATYGALKYPGIFGKAGAFSPAYWFNISNFVNYIQENPSDLSPTKIIHLAGKSESPTMENFIDLIHQKLQAKGLQKVQSKVKIDADGTHSETYWRREFGAAYVWLFANSNLAAQ